jgi:hypothetical protein
MSDSEDDRTASLMTPARLAQLQVRPKPAASPAAWLDALAADAGSGHIRRLVDLRGQLDAQLRAQDHSAAAGALATWGDALQKLDFSLVQPRGWLARATGKGKEAAAGFVAQVDRIGRAGEDLVDEARGLQKKQQAAAAGADRILLEIDAELRAIEKIMDQGARWLQDMRNQLKAREAQGGDAAAQQQIRADEDRCETLVARLKQLRSASSAGQQAVECCKGVLPRRAALGEALQRLQDAEWKAWQKCLGPVADEAQASGAAPQALEGAGAAHRELQSAVAQAAQDCASLQSQEQALAAELEAMQEPLRAAA